MTAPEGNFGEAMLAPPSHSRSISVPAGGLIEAEWRRTPSSGGGLNAVAIVGLIARPAPRGSDAVIAEAVAAAVAAHVAIVVVRFTEEQETESIDKTTLQLPGRQNDLVEAVAAAAKRTIVVVNAATPAIMPWLGTVDLVLWAGLPRQEGGHAIAAALLGALEPAGRLVTTFPTDDALSPAWSVTPDDGDLPYTEGTFIGYRGHFAGNAPEPAFWFGHGLGYGSWEYTDARLSCPTNEGDLAVSVTVRNTSDRISREVVQLYFQPIESDQPVRLVGWAAATVEADQFAEVAVSADQRLWRRWDIEVNGWTDLAPGGKLRLARGLGDIRARIDLPGSLSM